MFFVIIYSAIDQGYIGLSLASCHKDEIWDLRAELGLIWDHFKALAPIGTKSQIWDIIASTVLVIRIFSFPRHEDRDINEIALEGHFYCLFLQGGGEGRYTIIKTILMKSAFR